MEGLVHGLAIFSSLEEEAGSTDGGKQLLVDIIVNGKLRNSACRERQHINVDKENLHSSVFYYPVYDMLYRFQQTLICFSVARF